MISKLGLHSGGLFIDQCFEFQPKPCPGGSRVEEGGGVGRCYIQVVSRARSCYASSFSNLKVGEAAWEHAEPMATLVGDLMFAKTAGFGDGTFEAARLFL